MQIKNIHKTLLKYASIFVRPFDECPLKRENKIIMDYLLYYSGDVRL